MMKYKLLYWELKERNFNKKKTLKKFAMYKDGVKIHDIYEMRKDAMYAVDLKELKGE